MKPVCLIASYGGSGSTFLTSALKSIAQNRYDFEHVHGVPTSDFLGVPVFNRITGHGEGPFSKKHEIHRSAKVLLIYRDPAEAYLSRCCFKHFMHIWSETDLLDEVFEGLEVSQGNFNKLWQKSKHEERDILNLKRFFEYWRGYAKKHRHDVCFVRYEKLAEAWTELLGFLDIEETGPSAVQNFSPRPRQVAEVTARMFAGLREEINTWPPIEIFPMEGEPVPPPKLPLPVTPISLRDTVFTVERVGAGANDAIERIALVADIVTTYFGEDVRLSDYRNYHSREVDFLELFGLRGMVVTPDTDQRQREQVQITTRDLIFHLMYDPSFFREGMEYLIQPVSYPNSSEVQRLVRLCGLKRSFLGKLRYTPRNIVFPDGEDSVKVVVHLRRQDICGEVLLEGAEAEELPEKLRNGLHSRRLLTVEEAVKALENRFPPATKIQLVITSDGVDRIRHKFSPYPAMLARLDAISEELQSMPESSLLHIELLERIIGTGTEETIRTMDAMHTADLVITASSTFPRLACRTGKTELQIIRLE